MGFAVGAFRDIVPPLAENDLCHGEAFVFLEILPVSLKVEDSYEVAFPAAVVEIAEVANLLEAFWKHMEQEALHKLQRGNGNGARLLPVLAAGSKNDFVILHGDNAGIRDSHFVDIPPKILDGVPIPIESLLDFGNPFAFIKAVAERAPFAGIAQPLCVTGKSQLSLLPGKVERGKEFPPQFCGKDAFRNEERILIEGFKLPVRGKAAAGDYRMDMRVEQKLLRPCMEYLYDPGEGPKMAWVSGQLYDCLPDAFVEHGEQQLPV